MARLTAAWAMRQRGVWQASMAVLAQRLARAALDSETIAPAGWRGQARKLGAALGLAGAADASPQAQAMAALAARLDTDIRRSTAALIHLHGLDGQAGGVVLAQLARHFARREPVSEDDIGWTVAFKNAMRHKPVRRAFGFYFFGGLAKSKCFSLGKNICQQNVMVTSQRSTRAAERDEVRARQPRRDGNGCWKCQKRPIGRECHDHAFSGCGGVQLYESREALRAVARQITTWPRKGDRLEPRRIDGELEYLVRCD